MESARRPWPPRNPLPWPSSEPPWPHIIFGPDNAYLRDQIPWAPPCAACLSPLRPSLATKSSAQLKLAALFAGATYLRAGHVWSTGAIRLRYRARQFQTGLLRAKVQRPARQLTNEQEARKCTLIRSPTWSLDDPKGKFGRRGSPSTEPRHIRL
jgi:hypothetical protein